MLQNYHLKQTIKTFKKINVGLKLKWVWHTDKVRDIIHSSIFFQLRLWCPLWRKLSKHAGGQSVATEACTLLAGGRLVTTEACTSFVQSVWYLRYGYLT